MTRAELYEKAISLPLSPGVYIMKNSSGDVVYVGKSKKLRNRVSQYFANIPHAVKTEKMVESVFDFDYILTDSEGEALILENIQIKKYLPKYNILLKDDKNYPYIKLGAELFPKLSVVRKRTSDKGEYFGPYSTGGSAFKTAETVSRMFALPTCNRKFPGDFGKERPCLNYHIGRCMGVCTGKISKEQYAKTVSDVRMFLKGHQENVINSLTEKMNIAAENLEFEKAAAYRDTVKQIKMLREKQKVQGDTEKNADFIAVYDSDDGSALVLATVRDGCFTDKLSYRFTDRVTDDGAVCSALYELYSVRTDIPKRIYTSFDASGEDFELMTAYLCEKAGTKVKISEAKIGDNKKLCDMVLSNAKEYVFQHNERQSKNGKTLVSLAKLLSMDVIPERIESYDVSNWGDDFISTGMVVIENGVFAKRAYRSFNAKKNIGQNDCACMAEAVERRLKRALEKDDSFLPLPDLILVDGGKAQVHAVKAVAEQMGIPVYVFGMVKDVHHKTRTLTDGEGDISIAKDGEIFGFIYKIQEEVHRFSLSRMDRRRREGLKHSSLEKYKGIGSAKAKALMEHFGSLEALKKASAEDISKVKGFSASLAENFYEELHKKYEGDES